MAVPLAYSRIGHLICEVFLKLKAVGLTNGNSFDFPKCVMRDERNFAWNHRGKAMP